MPEAEERPYRTMARLLPVFLVLGLGLFLWHDHAASLEAGRAELRQTLETAASRSRAWLAPVDETLGAIGARLVALEAEGRNPRAPAEAEPLRDHLIERVSLLHPVMGIGLLDAEGRWFLSSRFRNVTAAAARRDMPDWRYLLEHRPAHGVLFGPVPYPGTGETMLAIGRLAQDAQGRPVGAVFAALNTQAIAMSLGAAPEGRTRLLLSRPDGVGLLALPAGTASIPPWLHPSWQGAITAGRTLFEATDPEGQVWLVGQAAAPAPLMIVTVMTPRADLLHGWRQRALVLGGAAALLLAGALVLLPRLDRRAAARAAALARQGAQALQTDRLTRLPNRAGLLAAAQARPGAPLAVHLVSIDRFKAINDTYGHAAGDLVLCRVAERLRATTGAETLLARISGEDFAVIQHEGREAAQAEALAQRLLEALAEPFHVMGHQLLLGASLGLADARGGAPLERLLSDASAAMHRARESGTNTFRWFEAQTGREQREAIAIEQDLRAAIGTEQLFMVYQPIYRPEEEAVAGFEALIRWKHPERGFIPPSVFIPVAERTGLIAPLDRLALRAALAAAAAWPAPMTVSVNLPSIEFRNPDLPGRIKAGLAGAGLAPERLTIEVTESILLGDEQVVLGIMQELKSIGVRLAIDDFGTGHAGLSYLHRFPFDRLKIDQSFIRDMDASPAASAIIEAAMVLSRRLDLDVVAEGVETTAQLRRLREFGCRHIQGYLIARPMEAGAVAAFLRDFRPPQA